MSRTAPPRRRRGLWSWLNTVDPGAVRRRNAGRAGLAAVCSWATVRGLIAWADADEITTPALVAVIACLVGSLAIGDARPRNRLISIASACGVAVGVLAVAALLSDDDVARYAMLLVLMFTSFATRRFLPRVGEMSLIAVMTFYFGSSNGVSTARFDWFAIATVVGYGWLLISQFVLIPLDPRGSLEAAARSFYGRIGDVVDDVRCQVVVDIEESGNRSAPVTDLRRNLERVAASRRVMEAQLATVVLSRNRRSVPLEQLQTDLFAAEQGLGMIVDAVTDPSWLRGLEPATIAALVDALDALANVLAGGASADAVSVLQIRADALRLEVDAAASAAVGSGSAMEFVWGTRRVSQSVIRARALVIDVAGPHDLDATSSDPADPGSVRLSPRHSTPIHPTTVLGLQAVVAATVALGVGRLLAPEHVGWVIWTAFVVVAGSAGETRRRMLLRVIGTVLGASIGVTVALALPDRRLAVAAMSTIGIMAAIAAAPISYTRMVLWFNVAFVPVYAQLGAREVEFLRQRPIATAIGGGIAALITSTLLPLRITDSVYRTIERYLVAVDAATSAWIEACRDPTTRPAAELATTIANAEYETVRTSIAVSTFETNPFPGVAHPFANHATTIGTINACLHNVARVAPDSADRPSEETETLEAIGAQIHERLVRPATVDIVPRDDRSVTTYGLQPVEDALVWAFVELEECVERLPAGSATNHPSR